MRPGSQEMFLPPSMTNTMSKARKTETSKFNAVFPKNSNVNCIHTVKLSSMVAINTVNYEHKMQFKRFIYGLA